MKFLTGAPLALLLHASFCVPSYLSAATIQPTPQGHSVPSSDVVWQSAKAEHVYGFSEIKAHTKGTLTLSADALTFSKKSGNASIPRSSLTAVSAGNERVELWGIEGRIMRMAIPDSGGLAAAAVLHHRIDMLTVEFRDSRGGGHRAVFFLPANEAERALASFALGSVEPREVSDAVCQNTVTEPGSVLVYAPNWDQAEVPAVYRALVYEHVVDRLRRTKGVGHVYRDGENNAQTACPQYTIHISIATFKAGSSVERAFMGPVGMFVGTTQMKFDVTFADSMNKLNTSEQITATMRGESESTDVADHLAKSLAKHYVTALKKADKSQPAKTVNPTS